MKKTLLLTAVLASASAYAAGTTGMVKVTNDTETKLTTGSALEVQGTTTTPKVEFELKVKDTGFSFGGDYKIADIKPLYISETNKLVADGKVWAKYEIPEMYGVKSYVKGELSQEFKQSGTISTVKVSGEADVKYDYEGYELGLNTKTSVPIFKISGIPTLLADVESVHTVSVAKKELSVLKDLKASVAVKHAWAESEEDAKDAFKSVEVKAEGSYREIKDLDLKGEVSVKYSDVPGEEFELKGEEKNISIGKSVTDKFKLTAEYKGIDKLTLTGVGFIEHMNVKDTDSVINYAHYGLDLKAEYKAMENLSLMGRTMIAGTHTDIHYTGTEKYKANAGYVELEAGAKYDYKVTDKFTVSPEANLKFVAKNIHNDGTEVVGVPELTLTPKVSAEYKISDALTLGGAVETPVKFENNSSNEFGYANTTVKTNLNLKYTW